MTAIIQGNAGFDWGAFGGSNRAMIGDRVFHYGVIPAADVLQAWFDSAESVYPKWDNESYDDAEVSGFVLDDGDYSAFQDADDTDIFITRSAYYTFSAFCSPCAPGAGYLRDARGSDNGVMTFCLSHDFFDDNIAPYGVWRVDSGALVIPDNPHLSLLQYTARDDFSRWVQNWRDFNFRVELYADKWGTKQESRAVRLYIAAIESAFDAGGYDRVVACGTFEKMAWCE